MEQQNLYYHIQNTNKNNYVSDLEIKKNNILQYIKYLVITSIIMLLLMVLNKIIVTFYNYLKKLKKQMELNSALINSLIENNDNKNLKFDETVNILKRHIKESNNGMYNDIANIERQFYNETNKISECINNIELINHNVVKTSAQTKINLLVEKINKYFEFFRELDLKKGENYKKKLYFELNRMEYSTVKDIQLHDGFNWFYSVNPYEITPLLMKYFVKYYDKTIDKFYPLQFSVFSGEETLDWYHSEQNRQSQLYGNELKKCNTIQNIKTLLGNCSMTHITFMNRNSVRLLDETDEEFELKILQHILYELQDKYVFYKQIDFYTNPTN